MVPSTRGLEAVERLLDTPMRTQGAAGEGCSRFCKTAVSMNSARQRARGSSAGGDTAAATCPGTFPGVGAYISGRLAMVRVALSRSVGDGGGDGGMRSGNICAAEAHASGSHSHEPLNGQAQGDMEAA